MIDECAGTRNEQKRPARPWLKRSVRSLVVVGVVLGGLRGVHSRNRSKADASTDEASMTGSQALRRLADNRAGLSEVWARAGRARAGLARERRALQVDWEALDPIQAREAQAAVEAAQAAVDVTQTAVDAARGATVAAQAAVDPKQTFAVSHRVAAGVAAAQAASDAARAAVEEAQAAVEATQAAVDPKQAFNASRAAEEGIAAAHAAVDAAQTAVDAGQTAVDARQASLAALSHRPAETVKVMIGEQGRSGAVPLHPVGGAR